MMRTTLAAAVVFLCNSASAGPWAIYTVKTQYPASASSRCASAIQIVCSLDQSLRRSPTPGANRYSSAQTNPLPFGRLLLRYSDVKHSNDSEKKLTLLLAES